MSRLEQFQQAMEAIYRRAGREADYWANYFNRDLKRKGALTTAKKLLEPRKKGGLHSGWLKLIDSGLAHEISVESLALRPEFRDLFSPAELAEAQRRLDALPPGSRRVAVPVEQVFPEALPADGEYFEGAVETVKVNRFERDRAARAMCIRKYGPQCAVCDLVFGDVYGSIGDGFIHVHHRRPLATRREGYSLDPERDLVPVCPNCHAMLHTSEPPLSVEELRTRVIHRRSSAQR